MKYFNHLVAGLSAAFCIAGVLTSCNNEFDPNLPEIKGDGDTPVTINLNVEGMNIETELEAATRSSYSTNDDDLVCVTASPRSFSASLPATRAGEETIGINDPDPVSETIIKNLVVLQFNGTMDNDNAVLQTSVYISDYENEAKRTISLVGANTPQTIVYLANTYISDPRFLPGKMTLGELKDMKFGPIHSMGDVVSLNPNRPSVGDETKFPDDGYYYQRLSGIQQIEKLEAASDLPSCTLKHDLVKVQVNVKNLTADTSYPVTLKSIGVDGVPGCMYMFTAYDGFTGKPTNNDLTKYGTFSHADVAQFTVENGAAQHSDYTGDGANFVIYLPANERGVATNTDPKQKNSSAPNGSTILKVRGTYHDSTLDKDVNVTYSFALGADMTQDFNLKANGVYQYNITLNARGNKDNDDRVAYNPDNGIDYTTYEWPRANCYIVHPSDNEEPMTYKIPIDRIDRFWKDYENNTNNTLGTSVAWTAKVIWSDIDLSKPNSLSFTAEGNYGTGCKLSEGKSNYFEVQVPQGAESGNVVIGVYKGDDLLWSWHLWITDYSPEDAFRLKLNGSDDGSQQKIPVKGGYVQRLYKNGPLLMDRCVGVIDGKEYTSGSGTGAMYYAWGRKDPFTCKSTIYQEGHISATRGSYFLTRSSTATTTAADAKNVPYTVQNPNICIHSNPWTDNDIYNTGSNYWMDPRYSENGNKSIFDPSPSGWCVPERAINADTKFTSYSATDQIITGTTGFGTFTFPMVGDMHYTASNWSWFSGMSSGGSSHNFIFWASKQYSKTNAYVHNVRLYSSNNNGLYYKYNGDYSTYTHDHSTLYWLVPVLPCLQ